MPTKGSPHRTYRRSDDLHDQDRQAAEYFGEAINAPILKALDERLFRWEHELAQRARRKGKPQTK